MTLTPTHEENGSTFYDTIATVNGQSKFRSDEYRLSVDGPSGGYWQAGRDVGPLTIGATYHFRLKSKEKQKSDGYYQDIVKAAPADGSSPPASAAPRGGGASPSPASHAAAGGRQPLDREVESNKRTAFLSLTDVVVATIARGADDWGVWDEVWARWKSAYKTLWGDAAPAAQPAPAGGSNGGNLPPEVEEAFRQGYAGDEPEEDGEEGEILPW